ncbi:hypothetical protein J5868_00965, partial [Candidatus Saccharibacteria bacterium]|nr:hypothetical protein [Candidatus Saccharibacteria bacterium]
MRKHYYKDHILCIVAVTIISLLGVSKVSALGYQNNVGVSFTFEPVLAINLSSNALIIPNLTPGSSAYSNTITI